MDVVSSASAPVMHATSPRPPTCILSVTASQLHHFVVVVVTVVVVDATRFILLVIREPLTQQTRDDSLAAMA